MPTETAPMMGRYQPRYLPQGKPRYRITPPAVLLAAMAALTLLATLLVVVGLAVGDRVDKPWVMVLFGLLMAASFGNGARRAAALPDVATALPAEAAASALVAVRSRFGVVFWLLSSLATAMLVLSLVTIERLALQNPQERNADIGGSGAAAIGVAMLMVAFCLAITCWIALVPARIIRWRKRTHMYLSSDGIGWTPADEDDPGFLHWHRVKSVWYSSGSIRGIVYTHRWRIEDDGDLAWQTIAYPAGATPRPRYIRKRIRELAPGLDIH